MPKLAPAFIAARFGVQIASGPEAFDLGAHQSAQFRVIGVTGYGIVQALHKQVVYAHPRPKWVIAQFINKSQPLHVVTIGDLIWCQRIACRGALRHPSSGFTLCHSNPVLKLGHCAR